MSRHTFLTSSSVFGDKTETVEILSPSDINQILDRRLKTLNSTVDRLDRECRECRKRVEDLEQNRNWLWENVDIIKKFLVGNVEKAVGLMQTYSANNHNVLGGLDAAWETRLRLDKLPDSCREIFGSVIKDCLTPELETFGRQIGSLESQIGRVDKTREEMLQREKSLVSELETFGRQIDDLKSQIERVDKTREEMLQREKSLASELNACRNLAQNRTERVSWFGRIIAWFKRNDTASVASEEV